jgi:hypothetical protein
MMKPNPHFKVGDLVRVIRIPPALSDSAGIGTPGVFEHALGKTFRVDTVDQHGHLEFVVAERRPSNSTYESDTIWIEPEFVEPVSSNATI